MYLLQSIKQKMDLDFWLEVNYRLSDCPLFYRSPLYYRLVHFDYNEYTPFNKGCLYKIRKYIDHYEVFYGTKKMCWSNSLKGVMSFIQKHKTTTVTP